jgi:DNA-3-methyladenine glycosylase I
MSDGRRAADSDGATWGSADSDGAPLRRCDWADSTPEYQTYHDDEWGVPLHGENQLFERLTLEAFQSGLSWLTILRKRENFRAAFANFDVASVAAYGEVDRLRLLADVGIVRNHAKVAAAINNARAIRDQVPEGLTELLWSFAPTRHRRPKTLSEVPAVSDESKAMAKELKRRGFAFVGPTTAYALMQATGIVDDHVRYCWRARPARDQATAARN